VPTKSTSNRGTVPFVTCAQVRTMASAGVLMVAHGAAALNTIFQQQRSVLMEVFPYKRRRFGFMAAAQAAGQFYMPLFPHVKPWTGKSVMNETKFMDACDHISGIETNRVSVCDAAQKVVTIRVRGPGPQRLPCEEDAGVGGW
jgi:hypothetical protein